MKKLFLLFCFCFFSMVSLEAQNTVVLSSTTTQNQNGWYTQVTVQSDDGGKTYYKYTSHYLYSPISWVVEPYYPPQPPSGYTPPVSNPPAPYNPSMKYY